ncbi:MAG: HDOD domain-containing protein [Proteobacteria bacterium]|jgi:HD-like signal output (HDOD) protein|nr:HDOD domain-containing protein [Pseudomonadota bacterium]MDA1292109.1 HDOD domain-containing protein [Pseudomonadota bacterium]
MQASDLRTAFCDAMFDSTDNNLNPVEEQAIFNVRSILNDPNNLSSYISPLPILQIKLLQLLENPEVEFHELSSLIDQDPALATRVLRTVNSPMFLTRGKAKDLHSAIKRLGISGISNIASSILMEKVRPHKPIYYKMFGRQIWEHSLHCAFLCRGFSKEQGEDEFSGHFLGLIHDVGKIIIFNCLNDAFSKGILEGEPGSKVFKEMMSEMSGDISYFIAREWNLPEKFWMAMFEQTTEPQSTLAVSLHRANYCAELYLLHEQSKITEAELNESIDSLHCNGVVWQEFLGKAKHLAQSI